MIRSTIPAAGDQTGAVEAPERVTIEVCAGDVESALAAAAGGADRIELAAALEVGGVTPSCGALATVRAAVELPLVVLVRPRRGDFLYGAAEQRAIEADLGAARDAGADGVALGALRADGTVDRELCARWVELARPLAVTFHRAFDLCRDLEEALETLIDVGVARVLTSGGAADVGAGRDALRDLVRKAGARVAVMPGGGVRAANARELVAHTGARELHLSASGPRASAMRFRRAGLVLGADRLPGEYERTVTLAERVAALRSALAAGPAPRPPAGGARGEARP